MQEKLSSLPQQNGRPHSCPACEGRAIETVGRLCPALSRERAALTEAERKIRLRGIWRGRRWFRALVEKHTRIAAMVDRNGGEVSDEWLPSVAELARVVERIRRIERQVADTQRARAAHSGRAALLAALLRR